MNEVPKTNTTRLDSLQNMSAWSQLQHSVGIAFVYTVQYTCSSIMKTPDRAVTVRNNCVRHYYYIAFLVPIILCVPQQHSLMLACHHALLSAAHFPREPTSGGTVER